MKKHFACFLTVCIVFCLTACGGNAAETPDTVAIVQTTGATQPQSATEATVPDQTEPSATSGETLPTDQTDPTGTDVTTPTEPVTTTSTEPVTTTSTEPVTTTPTEPVPSEPGHTHSYTAKVTKAATCAAEGEKTFTCACKHTYTETIPLAGHTWGEWKTTLEPTSFKEGASQRECSVCHQTQRKAIPMLPLDETAVTPAHLEAIKNYFMELVNLERTRVGVAPITRNTYLDSCAQTRSEEAITSFSHTRPNGQSYSSTVDISKYPYSVLGENLCMTSHIGDNAYTNADRWVGSDEQLYAAASWLFYIYKNSPGHYANMIKTAYTDCGIGLSYTMHEHLPLPIFYNAHIFGAQ